MNKNLLREALGPDDDGRAFTEAVLLRAAGALHRRRAAAAAGSDAPVFGWLERWARPWVIAALVGLAMLTLAPVLPTRQPPEYVTHALSADAATALLPEEVAAVTAEY